MISRRKYLINASVWSIPFLSFLLCPSLHNRIEQVVTCIIIDPTICLSSFLPPFELLCHCFLETAFKSNLEIAPKTLYSGLLLGEHTISWRLFNIFLSQILKTVFNFISAGSMNIYIHLYKMKQKELFHI